MRLMKFDAFVSEAEMDATVTQVYWFIICMEKEVIKVDGHSCTCSDGRCIVSVVHGKHHFACASIDGDWPVEPACHYDNPLGCSNYQTSGLRISPSRLTPLGILAAFLPNHAEPAPIRICTGVSSRP
jgi:hypothetical protein